MAKRPTAEPSPVGDGVRSGDRAVVDSSDVDAAPFPASTDETSDLSPVVEVSGSDPDVVVPSGSLTIVEPATPGTHPLDGYVFPFAAYEAFLAGDKSAAVYDPVWGVWHAAK